MSEKPVKSYDDLQQEAEARWREISALRTQRQTALDAQFATSPDVLNAPPIGTLYSHPTIVCACGGLAFTVLRYGCVNGVRDKATFRCQRCNTAMTWLWSDMTWAS